MAVPGRIAGEGDIDRHVLAVKGDHEITVHVGEPAMGDRGGRIASVPWWREDLALCQRREPDDPLDSRGKKPGCLASAR